MKRLYLTVAFVSLLFCNAFAQNEADRAVATLIADLAQLSKEKATFASMNCNKELMSQFNVSTTDPALQDMLDNISRLYMIYTTDASTAQLIRKRIQDLDSRKMLNNYTEVQQAGNKVLIYVPAVMQMTYAIGVVNSGEQNVLIVFSDDNFYDLVERLRTE
ncbi:MAG: DUF4252 domain-containing protein [Paludibacteraceae bacterium]|nr:DUF4252 domain-containing protein [Paludibacteraceae bacterium]